MLSEFDSVFATLVDLPPLRGHEHQITLKEGAQAICQKPYRYPYYQKNEIKKIMKELLFVGFMGFVNLISHAHALHFMCIITMFHAF